MTEDTLYNDVPLVGYAETARLCLWLYWPLVTIMLVIFWFMIFRPEFGSS